MSSDSDPEITFPKLAGGESWRKPCGDGDSPADTDITLEFKADVGDVQYLDVESEEEAEAEQSMQTFIEQQQKTVNAMREKQERFAKQMEALHRNQDTWEQERRELVDAITRDAGRDAAGDIPKCVFKCPTFDGETEWSVFLVVFETWLKVSGYHKDDYKTMQAGLLALALVGDAQHLLSELSPAERDDYEALKERLQSKYGGKAVAEVCRIELQSSNLRRPGQSISKFRDSLRQTVRRGYPELSREAREQIALDALLRSVKQEHRVQCIMQRCQTIDQAVAVIQTYEAAVGEPDEDASYQ